MAEQQTQVVADGQLDFTGGQDASKNPDLVDGNEVYASINASFQNGIAQPRDPFFELELIFPEGGVSADGKTPIPYKTIFEGGKFQSLIPYTIGSTPYIIIVISGVIFLINQDTLVVKILEISSGPRLNQYADRLNWSFGDKYIEIFDYPAFPAVVQDSNVFRSNTIPYGVPISKLGAYNQNRLFIANAGDEFTAGDPTGSLATPYAPITFTEVEAPSAPYIGQIFQLPTNYKNNPITAMGFLQLIDTSTGIGPLIVGTNSQVYSFNSQNPRTAWENGSFGQVIVSSFGIAGQRAQVNVLSDLFFASQDGQIRSLSMSRGEQGKYSKAPLSREVKNWLVLNEPELVKYYAMTYFNNKIFCTANPFRTTARDLSQNQIEDYAFGGMVVIELDNVSTISQDSPPTWAGLWTGIHPMDFCVNSDRCFVVSKDDGENRLWEIRPDLTYDTANEVKRRIKTTLYTRNFSFNDQFTYKNIIYGDFPFQNIQGKFHFSASYRPAQNLNFTFWNSYSHFAPNELCNFLNTGACNNGLAPHSFSELRFGSIPSTTCDLLSGKANNYFRKVQLKLEIEGGNWELSSFKLQAKTIPQSDQAVSVCIPLKPIPLCLNCNTDWIVPPFNTCESL